MTIKPFAIQGADLTLGGVNLQAGTTGVVIPGVTQASSYRVEEVEDVNDQTHQFAPDSDSVVVIDAALYNALNTGGDVSVFADFSVTTDDEGYIDEIKVNGQGTYTQQLADTASNNDMYAYVGTDPDREPFVAEDWIQIPFRPKMRAGEIETIGGGSVDGLQGNAGYEPEEEGDISYSLDFNEDITLKIYQGNNSGPEDLGPGISLGNSIDDPHRSGVIAIGNDDVGYNSKPGGVYIGAKAGWNETEAPQGENAIAIGARAAYTFAEDNSITLNATGVNLDPTGSGLFIKPIQEGTNSATLNYDTTTGEVTYSTGGGLAPQLTKVDNKIRIKGTLEMGTNPGGSVSTLDSDENTYIWFNSATGDSNGNKYAIGGDDYGNNFLISYNPDGSLRWKYTFDNIDYNSSNWQVKPYTIKHVIGEGELIYVGFDVANISGVVSFDTDGNIVSSWTWEVDGASSLDHLSLEVDPSTGNPIIGGRAYGEWINFDNVSVDQGLIEEGILSINRVTGLNNITNVSSGNTSNWNIDIDGTTNWYQPAAINKFQGIPVTTVTGVGGYRQLNGGNSPSWSYLDGALTVDNSGANPILTITAANWYATADLNAILNHGIGQTYNLILNVSDGYTFQTTHSWAETVPGVSGVWTVEGTLTPLGTPPISTAVNVNVLTFGSNVLLNVYYYIDENGVSYYDYVEINTMGTGYVQGDQIKIPGSALGGVDLVTTGPISPWISNGGPVNLTLIYSQENYPTLGTTVQSGWLVNGAGLTNALVTNVQSIDYSGTPAWQIDVAVASSNYSPGDVTFNNAGNDLFLTYYIDWGYAQIDSGRPIQNTVRFLMDQSLTGTTFNIRQSTNDQAFIATTNWTTTIGNSRDQEFSSISLDKTNNILYAIGDFNTPSQNDETLIAFDYEDGSIIWQKNFDDGTEWTGNASVVADGANNCVYVPFENDNGQICVMKLGTDGNLLWAVKLQNNNWDYEPQGAIDSNGDLILVGTYNIYNPTFDSWANEMFFTKLSKTDGTQLWANSITRNISQRNDIYFNYDVDNNWVNIVNDIVYVGGYTYDANNNYNVGIAVAVSADGSGTGDYEGWTYHVFDSLGVDTITNDMTFNTTTYDQVDQLAISQAPISYMLSSDQSGWSTYSVAIGGGSKVKFEDGSELSSAGITRFSKDGGGTERELSADMNGKFMYYDNSNNYSNSFIYIPANADVALPIGYTVTVIVGNMNGYSIYVNNNGNNDVVIYHAGSSDGVNNNWTFANDGNPGIYTIMKVDTNTWMLAGPTVNVD